MYRTKIITQLLKSHSISDPVPLFYILMFIKLKHKIKWDHHVVYKTCNWVFTEVPWSHSNNGFHSCDGQFVMVLMGGKLDIASSVNDGFNLHILHWVKFQS